MFRPWLALSPISQYVLMVVAVCYYTSGFTRIFKFSKPNIFSHLLYGRKWVRIVPILSCICVCLVHCSFWSNKWARLTEPYTWLWLPYVFRQFSSTILSVSLQRILFPSSFNAKAQFVIPKKSNFSAIFPYMMNFFQPPVKKISFAVCLDWRIQKNEKYVPNFTSSLKTKKDPRFSSKTSKTLS